ncbi:hypothetical protein [Granulicella sibirica]|uniref:hypothetical protein n=1 Tax=Granulicella sibirica TaxID=2479048 RepID=UPI00100899AF|nr:hypothetical protein [Granulicella sibirica]
MTLPSAKNAGDSNGGVGQESDAATGTDLLDGDVPAGTATTAPSEGATSNAADGNGALGSKQKAEIAGMTALPSPLDSSVEAGDGAATIAKSRAAVEDDQAKSVNSAQPDAASQSAVLANALLPAANSQPLAAANQAKVEAAQNGSSVDNALASSGGLKSGGSKQLSASGKDRAAVSDAKTKGKSEDEGMQTSSQETDASFAAKIPAVVAVIDHQPAGLHTGNAGGDAAQQAVQAATANATPSNALASESTASNATGAAQTAVPAQAASATAAQELPTLNSAHLIQSMGQSEMKLGMHSAEFGSISINTSLTHQALSAQISISHSALGQALAMHLPSIEQKLGSAYGLQARVEVKDSSGTSAGDSGRQSENGRQSQTSGSSRNSSIAGIGMAAAPATTTTSLLAKSSRLDIRI